MSDWKEKILSQHIGLRHGYQFRESDFTENGIQVIKICNVTADGLNLKADVSYVSINRTKEFESITLKEGDILMSLTGNIGRVVEVKKLGNRILFQNYRVGAFYPLDENIYKPFIKWILSSEELLKQLNSHSNQSAQANFGKQDLDKLKFKIPTSKEQHQITHILSTSDAVIEKTQAAIAKYKAIKQGMLHDLFTRGIDLNTGKLRPKYENAPELYKESKLGMIPREWEVDMLGNVCDVTSSKRIYANEYDDFGIPFYRSLEIILKSKKQEIETTLYISNEKYDAIEKQFGVPKYGDILITSVGTLGISYRVSKQDLFYFKDGNLIWFRNFSDKEYSKFLQFTLDELIRKQFDKITIGTSQKAFTIDKLKKLDIYVPKAKEHKVICERVETINQKLHTEQIYLNKLQQLKAGLMGDLMSGRKSVTVPDEVLTQTEN